MGLLTFFEMISEWGLVSLYVYFKFYSAQLNNFQGIHRFFFSNSNFSPFLLPRIYNAIN